MSTYKYMGTEMLRGQAADKWVRSFHQQDKTNTYTFHFKKGSSIPLRLHIMGYNILGASHYDGGPQGGEGGLARPEWGRSWGGGGGAAGAAGALGAQGVEGGKPVDAAAAVKAGEARSGCSHPNPPPPPPGTIMQSTSPTSPASRRVPSPAPSLNCPAPASTRPPRR